MLEEDKDILADFRLKLPLDRFELERECCQQALIYDEIGSWVAGVKARAKIAKEHISFVESELSLEIRKDPSSFGLPADKKPTEGTITAVVAVHERYKQAFVDYVEADRLANDASTLLVSAEQRKSGLRDLVQLYIKGLYSQDDGGLDTSGWEAGERGIQELRAKRVAEEEDLGEDHVEEDS